MIVDSILGLIADALSAILGAISTFTIPGFSGILTSVDYTGLANSIGGKAHGWGNVVDWSVAEAVVTAFISAVGIAIIVRLLRRALSLVTGGGGGA